MAEREPSWGATGVLVLVLEEAAAAAAAAACWARLPLGALPLPAAVMFACNDVSSFIMRSFWSCLSAWTVCACWRRLSRRENCFPQWQVNGRSPVCFLQSDQGSAQAPGGDEDAGDGCTSLARVEIDLRGRGKGRT